MPRAIKSDLVTTRRRAARTPAPSARDVIDVSQQDGALGFAHAALNSADSKKASQILLLDVHEISMFTDYFLLCNGESERQIKAIAEGIEESLRKAGAKQRGHEGTADSGWILLDYGDLTIHIFAPEQRDYYQLEELWKDAKTVVKMQ